MRECSHGKPILLSPPLALADDIEQYSWPPKDPLREGRETRKARLPGSDPFTYGNNTFNPALKPGNSATLRAAHTVRAHPPWHPDFDKRDDDDGEQEEDAAQAAGVDTGETCIPPGMVSAAPDFRAQDDGEHSSSCSEDEEDERTMTRSRVRRGSEGYEVRPKRFDVAYAAQELHDAWSSGDDSDVEGDDERQWDWQRQRDEEERLRVMLEDEMKRTGSSVAHDPPADWLGVTDDGAAATAANTAILLPSQVMRRRNQWHDYLAQPSGSQPTPARNGYMS